MMSFVVSLNVGRGAVNNVKRDVIRVVIRDVIFV